MGLKAGNTLVRGVMSDNRMPLCFLSFAVQYVVVRQDGRLEWEPGENRCIHVPPPGLAAALEAAKKVVSGTKGGGRQLQVDMGRCVTPNCTRRAAACT